MSNKAVYIAFEAWQGGFTMARPESISEFTLANNQQDNNSIERRKNSVTKHLTKSRYKL